LIGIAVTVEAFEAVAETLSHGSVLYEAEVTGERLIRLRRLNGVALCVELSHTRRLDQCSMEMQPCRSPRGPAI
jgi:hypothetical protein